jgi:hypothetical protein
MRHSQAVFAIVGSLALHALAGDVAAAQKYKPMTFDRPVVDSVAQLTLPRCMAYPTSAYPTSTRSIFHSYEEWAAYWRTSQPKGCIGTAPFADVDFTRNMLLVVTMPAQYVQHLRAAIDRRDAVLRIELTISIGGDCGLAYGDQPGPGPDRGIRAAFLLPFSTKIALYRDRPLSLDCEH